MRKLLLDEALLQGEEDAHALLKSALAFPAYYGENLSALSDCLGDIVGETCIELVRAPLVERKEWLDGFVRVISRNAAENPDIEFLVREAGEQAGYSVIGERLDRIEQRLATPPEATQVCKDAAPAASTRDAEVCRNTATGSEGDRFACSECGCRMGDWLEESRFLFDGLPYCPNCGRKVANPGGTDASKWISELI